MSRLAAWAPRALTLALVLGLSACDRAEEPTPAAPDLDAFRAAATQAYLIGYPAVELERTRRVGTNVAVPGDKLAPMNRFAHTRRLVTAADREVVTPNNDTPYSTAFLDLSDGPLVLHVPAFGERYFTLPFLSAYHEHFASIGQRSEAAAGELAIAAPQGGDFLITGPAFEGAVPDGMTQVPSPTNNVWIIGRPLVAGPDDMPALLALKGQMWIRPLASYQDETPPPPTPTAVLDPTLPPLGTPITDVKFFEVLADVVKDNPPTGADAPLLDALATLGITGEDGFAVPVFTEPQQEALAEGVGTALDEMEAEASQRGTLKNGWRMPDGAQGLFGGDHARRAAYAMVGLGVINSVEAVYPMARVDGSGEPLTGARRYTLTFPAGELPPAQAFWSLTMYGNDMFLVDNALDRYSLGDRSALVYGDDGSLTLYVQHDPPEDDLVANWLPAPEGGFYLVLRMYHPKAEVLDGRYAPPPLVAQASVTAL